MIKRKAAFFRCSLTDSVDGDPTGQFSQISRKNFRPLRRNGVPGCQESVVHDLFRIPFASAEKLDENVRREWATRRIYALIAAYTAHPKEETLRDMRIFAEHYQIPIPYEKEIK